MSDTPVKVIIVVIVLLVIGNIVWMFAGTKSYCKFAMFSSVSSVPTICLKEVIKELAH